MIIVSACLADIKCRYNGKSKPNDDIITLIEKGEAIAVCPELLGGLPIPRTPSEIIGGDGLDVLEGHAKVIDSAGGDRTDAFIKGGEKTLATAKKHGAKHAILKAKSPSCGCGEIYDGSFSGTLRAGDGVTAALLKKNGITVEQI